MNQSRLACSGWRQNTTTTVGHPTQTRRRIGNTQALPAKLCSLFNPPSRFLAQAPTSNPKAVCALREPSLRRSRNLGCSFAPAIVSPTQIVKLKARRLMLTSLLFHGHLEPCPSLLTTPAWTAHIEEAPPRPGTNSYTSCGTLLNTMRRHRPSS